MHRIALTLALSLLLPALAGAQALESLRPGAAELRSAGVLSFGPEGVLFVGDSARGGVFAIDTGDREAAGTAPDVKLPGIGAQVAALLGTSAEDVQIRDVAVNPISQRIYLSVSRGRGPDAAPVLLRTDASGELEALSLDQIPHSWAALPNPPAEDAVDRRGRPRRLETITDLGYLDGVLYVAGLSNEEFASNLRTLEFPFSAALEGTSVEIFHGAHGRYETNSPVRTFVPYAIAGEPHLLAAYTCTPLVRFPVSELEPGGKLRGTTIAELGNRNRPLDMIVYEKDGENFLLMANSSRGVMKMSAEGLGELGGITERTGIAGLPYETLEGLEGIVQLDRYDDTRALVLARSEDALELRTIALP